MSFAFFNPDKVKALTDAGFVGRNFPAFSRGDCGTLCCGDGCCCHCPRPHPAGARFNPPAGTGTRAHDRAVKAALAAAGF